MALAGVTGAAALAVMFNFASIGHILPIVNERISDPPARPELLAPLEPAGQPVASASEWREARAPLLLAQLEQHVYGRIPSPAPVEVVSKRVLQLDTFKAEGQIEEWTLRSQAGAQPVEFHAVAVLPQGPGPFPVIIGESFCSNRDAFRRAEALTGGGPEHGDCSGGAFSRFLIKAIFGKYIMAPPYKRLLKRGYAVLMLHPGEVAPDRAEMAAPRLAAIAPDLAEAPDRPGTVAVWAWTFSRLMDAVEGDGRFDPDRQVFWGHSRYGKAALLAAAIDPRADAVVSLQSGTGGATLSRSFHGESVAQITQGYPHWFAPAYAEFGGREEALPVDQHALLALIAPRPILLGAARQDRWSDPKGAFRAALGADPVYELLGADGLDQPKMSAFDPQAEIAYFLRGGLHGVTTRDWKRTLQFLGAQFAKPRPAQPPTEEALQATPVGL